MIKHLFSIFTVSLFALPLAVATALAQNQEQEQEQTQELAKANPAQLNTLGAGFCEIFLTSSETSSDENLFNAIKDHSKHKLGDNITTESKPMMFRGRSIGTEVLIQTNESVSITAQFITAAMRAPGIALTQYRRHTDSIAELQISYGQDCTVQQVWQQFFDNNNAALYTQRVSPQTWLPDGERHWINPPAPKLAPVEPPRIRVGMIDSGVNYQLQAISNALARDRHGKLIGYDFWDMDELPYDAHPSRSPFMISRHGTRTASIVAAEAPGVAIVPYRYPRPDMSRMKDLVEHAAKHDVRIIGMPLGGNRFDEWAEFQRAAEAHPEILFIASAGNNGRDIDRKSVYPASLEIDNMLVVTSADDFVRPAERTNYGRLSVDYLLPAESISTIDYDGTKRLVSGSSYAVSRLVALAARIVNRTPAISTQALKKEIEKLSIRANTGRYVSTGYIGDLYAATAQVDFDDIEPPTTKATNTKHTLALDVFMLHEKWQPEVLGTAIDKANEIFAQCDIGIAPSRWIKVAAPPYLQNLSTGNALTLKQKLPAHNLAVYFVKDTDMQPAFDAEAFGEGNTANRPWLRNTLWITSATEDLYIALAHELFHIIVNNGGHTSEPHNLMRDRTDKSNIKLNARQCEAALAYATKAGLIIDK